MSQQDVDEQKARAAAHGGQGTGPGDAPSFAGLTVSTPNGSGFAIDYAGNGTNYFDAAVAHMFRVGFVPTFQVTTTKDLEIIQFGAGFICKSPNGTRWRGSVTDAGTTVWTAL